MYRNGLTLKQQATIAKRSSPLLVITKKSIPTEWENFAPLCKIRSGKKIIPFNPYNYQKRLSNLIDKTFGTVVTKTRQLGITETIANKFLHKACLNEGYTAVVLSKSQADTSNIARRVRLMISSLEDYIEPLDDSLTNISIKGGGRLLFRNSTINGCRGLESVSDILYDESSFVDGIEQIYDASIPSTEMVGDDARIIILSTPNGKAGFYWDKLSQDNGDKDIEQIIDLIKTGEIEPCQDWIDETGWAKMIIHWKAHPIYSQDTNYLENIQKKKKLSWATIQREYNLAFDEAEVNIFAAILVKIATIGDFKQLPGKPLFIAKQPEEQAIYYAGLDTSNMGDDYTVFIILKYLESLMEVVAMFRDRKHTMAYNLNHIIDLLNTYNPEKTGIEVTGGTGQIYLEQLEQNFSKRKLEAIKTTGESKGIIIDRLLLAHEQEVIKYPSGIIANEHISFRRNGRKLEAPSGKHDDTVMGLAFAVDVSPFGRRQKRIAISSIPSLYR
jgi:hypothetical protein